MHLNRKIYLIPKTLIDLVHWKYGFFFVVVSGFSLPPNVTLLLDSFPFWFFFWDGFFVWLGGWVFGGFVVVSCLGFFRSFSFRYSAKEVLLSKILFLKKRSSWLQTIGWKFHHPTSFIQEFNKKCYRIKTSRMKNNYLLLSLESFRVLFREKPQNFVIHGSKSNW